MTFADDEPSAKPATAEPAQGGMDEREREAWEIHGALWKDGHSVWSKQSALAARDKAEAIFAAKYEAQIRQLHRDREAAFKAATDGLLFVCAERNHAGERLQEAQAEARRLAEELTAEEAKHVEATTEERNLAVARAEKAEEKRRLAEEALERVRVEREQVRSRVGWERDRFRSRMLDLDRALDHIGAEQVDFEKGEDAVTRACREIDRIKSQLARVEPENASLRETRDELVAALYDALGLPWEGVKEHARAVLAKYTARDWVCKKCGHQWRGDWCCPQCGVVQLRRRDG